MCEKNRFWYFFFFLFYFSIFLLFLSLFLSFSLFSFSTSPPPPLLPLPTGSAINQVLYTQSFRTNPSQLHIFFLSGKDNRRLYGLCIIKDEFVDSLPSFLPPPASPPSPLSPPPSPPHTLTSTERAERALTASSKFLFPQTPVASAPRSIFSTTSNHDAQSLRKKCQVLRIWIFFFFFFFFFF